MTSQPSWLELTEGDAPLLLSQPHTGMNLCGLEPRLVSPWLARKDTDWWVDTLYDFARDLGASIVRTDISRVVIDVNRDPSGASLYPGQATTELCPTQTFDGEQLYRRGKEPSAQEIDARRRAYFDPYHSALAAQIARLRRRHQHVVIYDCHSIRSAIPRLFDGCLPHFNIGTNDGKASDPALADAVEAACAQTAFGRVVNGRFKGGFITRSHGRPEQGVHAIQMELACRGYMHETPDGIAEGHWPTPYDESYAAPMRAALLRVLKACLGFATHESISN